MNEFENNNNSTEEEIKKNSDSGFYNHKAGDIIQDTPSSAPQYDTPKTQQTPPTYTTAYNAPYQYPKKAEKFKKEKKTHSTAVVIVAAVLAAVIGAVSAIAVMTSRFTVGSNPPVVSQQNNTNDKSNVNIKIDKTASSIAEAVAVKCTDSVVGIRTTTSVMSFFGGSQEQTGNGSGVVYSSDGYIITNYHVISGAVQSSGSKIDVFVGDDKSDSYPAEVIGYNISCDLAVLKINVNGLKAVELGNSDELNVGQYVITIGAPGGLEFMGSVTYGIISGLDRTVSTNTGLKLIQTDAAINPGNSGGALLDAEGKLIGINSSKIASVEFEGMGFAIPINTVKEKCDKIISRKNDSGAYLGVSVTSTYTSQVLAFYGFPSGAVISSVAEDSPAAKAGIERGDIITKFNGIQISEYTVLGDALYDCVAGDTVSIEIYRNGEYYTTDVTLTSDSSN